VHTTHTVEENLPSRAISLRDQSIPKNVRSMVPGAGKKGNQCSGDNSRMFKSQSSRKGAGGTYEHEIATIGSRHSDRATAHTCKKSFPLDVAYVPEDTATGQSSPGLQSALRRLSADSATLVGEGFHFHRIYSRPPIQDFLPPAPFKPPWSSEAGGPWKRYLR
jgi:hypothetical protein